ncbi:MAG: hypothetical protein HYT71_01710 [Candidatus Aenigmarchaeota archaeon]|nr:hypothetical protein [Candidatus Aenigmarchaeota archaeon]
MIRDRLLNLSALRCQFQTKIGMPISVQKELAKNKGVYIEQCYSMYSIDKISMEKIAEQIKKIGAEKCIDG